MFSKISVSLVLLATAVANPSATRSLNADHANIDAYNTNFRSSERKLCPAASCAGTPYMENFRDADERKLHDTSNGRDPYDNFSKNFRGNRHLYVYGKPRTVFSHNFRSDRHLHVPIPRRNFGPRFEVNFNFRSDNEARKLKGSGDDGPQYENNFRSDNEARKLKGSGDDGPRYENNFRSDNEARKLNDGVCNKCCKCVEAYEAYNENVFGATKYCRAHECVFERPKRRLHMSIAGNEDLLIIE